MPDAEYRALPYPSNSLLTKFKQSAAHVRQQMLHGWAGTAAMKFGNVVHTLQLEPHLFDSRYGVTATIGVNFATKAGKAEKAAIIASGRECIKREQYNDAMSIIDAVKMHPSANYLFSEGRAEVAYAWEDEDTGQIVKGKADFIRPDHIIVDLKKTQDASPRGFEKSIGAYSYHCQAAHYSNGCRVLTGIPHVFVFVCVEEAAPHAVGVYTLDSEAMMKGNAMISDYLRRYQECVDSGVWSGYSDRIEEIGVPPWA